MQSQKRNFIEVTIPLLGVKIVYFWAERSVVWNEWETSGNWIFTSISFLMAGIKRRNMEYRYWRNKYGIFCLFFCFIEKWEIIFILIGQISWWSSVKLQIIRACQSYKHWKYLKLSLYLQVQCCYNFKICTNILVKLTFSTNLVWFTNFYGSSIQRQGDGGP